LALLSALNTHSRLFGAGNTTERGELLLVRGLTRHKSGRIKFKDLVYFSALFWQQKFGFICGFEWKPNFLVAGTRYL